MRQALYFTAPWCGPCQKLGPVMDELAKQFTIRKINVDYDPELPAKYNIRSVPTVVFFENDQEVERVVGAQSRDFYLQKFNQ
jgi:thioredoxin 1